MQRGDIGVKDSDVFLVLVPICRVLLCLLTCVDSGGGAGKRSTGEAALQYKAVRQARCGWTKGLQSVEEGIAKSCSLG